MKHIAIDLGSRESQICSRAADGKIIEERKIRTCNLPSYLKRQDKSRVIVESCAEAFAVADAAKDHGHQATVVQSTLARALGVGARRIKTDKRDARALSNVSTRVTLASVYIPSPRARELKVMLGMRDRLVQSRTILINNLRGWLRTKMLKLRSGAVKTFPQRLEKKLLNTVEGFPLFVQRQLIVIKTLNEQILAAEEELSQIAQQDKLCQRLMTVPGVGILTSLRFMATIDQLERFAEPHLLQSYIGLTPGERSSSMKKQRTSITKAGCKQLRWLLVQAAWSAYRTRRKDPMVLWAKGIEERRGRKIAIIALARKLSGILYAIWRDATVYKAQLSKS